MPEAFKTPEHTLLGNVSVNSDEDLGILYGLAHRTCGLSDHLEVDSEAVEIGSWAGSSALVLERMFDKVYCVDHWKGSKSDRLGEIATELGQDHCFRVFCRNMGDRLYKSVIPCMGTSLQYARIWPRQVALVYIDGDHTYEQAYADIRAWHNHILPGGIICGHDFASFKGVNDAVHYAFPEGNFECKGEMWWHVVK